MLTKTQILKHLKYNSESGVFTWKLPTNVRVKIGDVAGCVQERGYVKIKLLGELMWAHRMAWVVSKGKIPKNRVIDHIDGNPGNNSIKNLRLATRAQNSQNIKCAQVGNATGLLGVSKARNGKFRARIRINGVEKHLGEFSKPKQAHACYIKAKRIHHSGSLL